jgi:hypothetical protein
MRKSLNKLVSSISYRLSKTAIKNYTTRYEREAACYLPHEKAYAVLKISQCLNAEITP